MASLFLCICCFRSPGWYNCKQAGLLHKPARKHTGFLRRAAMKNFLMLVFTAVYFVIFFFVVDRLFTLLPLNGLVNILALVCLFIAFLASVGLAQFTVHKIKEWNGK